MQYEQVFSETESFIQDFFAKKISSEYVFHDLEHTIQTVAAVRSIAEAMDISDRENSLLQLATWFHDTGYELGSADHEERSCINATTFLKGKIEPADLEIILGCIRATKIPQSPKTTLEEVICDADLSHLGLKSYWDRNSKLRQEFVVTREQVMSDIDWVEFELDFMLSHEYHTSTARELFNKRKAKHIQQLLKQKRRLNPDGVPTVREIALSEDKSKTHDLARILKKSENEINQASMGRGVETMYRTTYRTHTNLSTMADSKANLMLSVNAIIISILVSTLIPQLKENHKLIIPTILLTVTCLGSMIFATLSTRPKVTEGITTREAIRKRNVNLLFFGNFYNMSLEDFQWGVNEMLKDADFLYSSMSRDLYYLGIVLAKKYRYLSYCYNIFMYGLIISVLSFGLAFIL